VALALVVAALVANRGGIAQYVTTGQVTIHWSFVIFGLFAILQSTLLVGFVVVDYLLVLFREKTELLETGITQRH